jgi:hypothetical protein
LRHSARARLDGVFDSSGIVKEYTQVWEWLPWPIGVLEAWFVFIESIVN